MKDKDEKKYKKAKQSSSKNPIEAFESHLRGINNMDEAYAEAIIMAKKI